uniref:general transcription factor IIH subunit 3 isoform X1 n=1 Tax=Myxine glutinosa TaxID=7769 RepID=UPI00358DDE2B
MSVAEDSSMLVIILDVNPVWWGQRRLRGEASLSHCLDSALVFANCYLASSRRRHLAFLACGQRDSRFLYPTRSTSGLEQDAVQESRDGRLELLSTLDDTVVREAVAMLARVEVTADMTTGSLTAGALAKALCYINRMRKQDQVHGGEMKGRIVLLAACEEAQYMNLMNVAFTAEKQDVCVDVCALGSESSLLQQVSGLTGGLYLRVPEQESLLQYLQWVFLSEPDVRRRLLLPRPSRSDVRPACFCHRQLLDIAYVCSVCLSIFCTFSPICSTCETAFHLALPPSLRGRKRKKGGSLKTA